MNEYKKKICIVALGAYPLLFNIEPKSIIGPDVNQVNLARELAKSGFSISFITYCDSPPLQQNIGDIKIITIPEKVIAIPLLNRIQKLMFFVKAFFQSKSEIFISSGGLGGIVSILCKLFNKKFVYKIESDAFVNKKVIIKNTKDFDNKWYSLNNMGNFFDIQLADSIIVLNSYQQQELQKNFGKKSILIKMPFPLTFEKMEKKDSPLIVLWVGTIAELKQPEIFIKLAEAIPWATFQMIGGHSGNQEYYDKIKGLSTQLKNFEFIGVVYPFDAVNSFFKNASVLVNASMFEGFPISFIQAWMNYTPVISLNADPDEIICQKNLGFHSKNYEQFLVDIKLCLRDPELRKKLGINGRRYVEEEHDFAIAIKKYEKIFNDLSNR